MQRQVIATRLGGVEVWIEDGRIRGLNLTKARKTSAQEDDPIVREIRRYFSGEAVGFENLPLDLDGCTSFERAVYDATRSIPFGQVATYGQIARAIGKPKAARAVGQALGHNPIAIVIPCHRVVAANGALGGFTGGLHWKKKLLRHEGALP